MSISTYTLFSDAAVETALDAVGGEMMGTQDTELLKQIFVAAGNGGGGNGGVISNPGVAYVRTDGNDSTAEIGNPAKPYQTATAAFAALKALINNPIAQHPLDLGVGDFTLELTAAEIAAGYRISLNGQGGTVDSADAGEGGTTLTITAYGDVGGEGLQGESIDVFLVLRSNLTVRTFITIVAGAGGVGVAGDPGGTGGAGGDLSGDIHMWCVNANFTGCAAGEGGAGGETGGDPGGRGANTLTIHGAFSVLQDGPNYGSVTGCYVDGTFTYV